MTAYTALAQLRAVKVAYLIRYSCDFSFLLHYAVLGKWAVAVNWMICFCWRDRQGNPRSLRGTTSNNTWRIVQCRCSSQLTASYRRSFNSYVMPLPLCCESCDMHARIRATTQGMYRVWCLLWNVKFCAALMTAVQRQRPGSSVA